MDRVVIKKIKALPNPHEEGQSSEQLSWVGSGYTKLYLWSLTEFKKVFYIDADCLIVGPLDDVFNREVDFAAAPDVFPPDKFNAGVLFLKPSLKMFSHLID